MFNFRIVVMTASENVYLRSIVITASEDVHLSIVMKTASGKNVQSSVCLYDRVRTDHIPIVVMTCENMP